MARQAIVAAALALGVFLAGPAAAETLPEALAKAYLNNPTLLAARAELRVVDEGVPQALSGWRPTVSATAEAGREWDDSETGSSGSAGGSDWQTPVSAALRLSQPIYRGGRTVAGTSQAENLVRAQRAALLSVEQDVLLRAATAYMDALRDEAVLQLTISNEQVLVRQLEATQDRFTVGEITRTDVAQSESRLARATALRIEAEGALTASRAIYREVIGDLPGALVSPDPLAGLPRSEAETVAGSADAPDLRAAEFTERAARDGIDVAFGELLPTVTLNGDVTTQDDVGSRNSQSDSASIAAQLVVPLYQAGAVASRVRAAKERVFQRRREIDEQRRRAEQQATGAWQNLETARAQIVSFESEVRATRIALDGVRQEAEVGARTVLDVLDAEQEALDAQVNLVTARRDEVVAGFQVLAAVGRLTARDLELAVEHYDSEEHYRAVRDKIWGVGPPVD